MGVARVTRKECRLLCLNMTSRLIVLIFQGHCHEGRTRYIDNIKGLATFYYTFDSICPSIVPLLY